jgi:PAB-dependent poly(A)-specific ribonuclease subunit 3
MNPSKIILTEKNRIRLNACAILDVVKHDEMKQYTTGDLQQKDFILFGKLILAIGTKTEFKRYAPEQESNEASHELVIQNAALVQLSQKYSAELIEAVTWLLTPGSPHEKNVDLFLKGISSQVVATLDSELHAADTRTSELSRELENGRLFRLVAKLGTINERPEYAGDASWRETGEMQMIKLFRDYVFHQVDEEGKPVIDLAHIVRCLNNLDVGTDEKVRLISRNGDQAFIITYKELKKQVASAWSDLQPRQKGRY